MGRLTRVLVALTRWGLGLCALLAVLVALYVSLGRELVPLVAEYRADVESKAEQALGLPVHVGALEGRWSGLAPVLRVRDLQLGEGATALRLDDVKVVPDVWASLTAREVRLARIQLGGLQLILRENEQGAWNLEGLPKKTTPHSIPPTCCSACVNWAASMCSTARSPCTPGSVTRSPSPMSAPACRRVHHGKCWSCAPPCLMASLCR